jgi:hypothetical protein
VAQSTAARYRVIEWQAVRARNPKHNGNAVVEQGVDSDISCGPCGRGKSTHVRDPRVLIMDVQRTATWAGNILITE